MKHLNFFLETKSCKFFPRFKKILRDINIIGDPGPKYKIILVPYKIVNWMLLLKVRKNDNYRRRNKGKKQRNNTKNKETRAITLQEAKE